VIRRRKQTERPKLSLPGVTEVGGCGLRVRQNSRKSFLLTSQGLLAFIIGTSPVAFNVGLSSQQPV